MALQSIGFVSHLVVKDWIPGGPKPRERSLGPSGIVTFRVIGLLQGLSSDWDHRSTREEILEMNDPNQPRPDPPELDGDPNLLREMIRQ